MADTESKVDSTIGGLANLSNAPDDALVVLEYLGKAYNSTMGQLKAALGAITGFAKTAGDSTPGTNDVYTITFGNGGKLDITIPIPKNGENGYTPQKGVDYNDGYTPQKGVDYHDGYTPQKGVDYADGISPTVDFKQMEDGVEITITDATGPHTAKLKNGADGVSPSFRVETIEGGYRVILSAAHEYQQFDLLNGESGDWNVNNPTWKGFIKGRTHWKEEYGVDGVVIEETSVTFSGTTQFQTISGIMSEAIQVGGKYTVTYNGVDYACIGKYYDGAYIGNGSFMNADVGNEEDTGEPFCIQLFGGDIYMLWKADKTKETVTVKVVGEKVVIWHKLDGGYLPEGVPHVETGVVEILPETTIELDPESSEGFYSDKIELITGNTYTVKWNGTEYNCVAQDFNVPIDEEGNTANMGVVVGDLGLMMGGESTGEPFIIIAASEIGEAEFGVPTAIQAIDGSTSVTLSISGEVKVFHKMDAECLLEGTPYAEPFDDVIMDTFPVFTTGLDGSYFTTPAKPMIDGQVYRVHFNGADYECVARRVDTPMTGGAVALGNGAFGESFFGEVKTNDPFAICVFDSAYAVGDGTIFYGMFNAISVPDDQAFSITGAFKKEDVNKHCLPETAPLVVTFTSDGSGNYTPDSYFSTVQYAINNKRVVTARIVKSTWFVEYIPLDESNPCDLTFKRIYFSDGALRCKKIVWQNNNGFLPSHDIITVTDETLS